MAILVWLVAFVCRVFFIRALVKVLSLTKRHHTIDPTVALYYIIPLLGEIWMLYLVGKVTEGVKGEFAVMRKDCGDAGEKLGYAFPSLLLLGYIPHGVVNPYQAEQIEFIQSILILASGVSWIAYWVKVAKFSEQILDFDDPQRHNRIDEKLVLDMERTFESKGDEELQTILRGAAEAPDQYAGELVEAVRRLLARRSNRK